MVTMMMEAIQEVGRKLKQYETRESRSDGLHDSVLHTVSGTKQNAAD